MGSSAEPNWNSFARLSAGERWRVASARMGRCATDALVADAKVESGMSVLDVASGSGEPAISIASLLNGTGKVVATDVSAEPLKIAAERARQRGLTNIEFQHADVHQLPFEDASFDRVTCRHGVMFFADLPRALREIRRVLKPGGRTSLLAWGSMRQPYFDTTIGTILRVVPDLTLPTSGMSMFKFAQRDALGSAMRDAGFQEVGERFETVPWNWPATPTELWEYFQDVTVPFRPLFQAIPPERRAEVDAAVLAAIAEHVEDNEVRFDATFVLASGTR